MNETGIKNGNSSTPASRLTSAVFLIVIIVAGFGICRGQPGVKSPVEFFKEEISMYIGAGEFSIHGLYYFRNNTDSDKPMPVVFPFHIDDSTHFPHEIKAFKSAGRDLETLYFKENRERGSISISIPMKPRETTNWGLYYTQKIDKPQATYILKSTRIWGKPLEEALYKIYIPKNFDVDYIWADVDSVTQHENQEVLWIDKTEYMPFDDMTIKWKRK